MPSKSYLDYAGLTQYDQNIKNYINNIITDDVEPELDSKEDTSNKVTSLSSSSTDTQYPSAKLLYDSLPTNFTLATGGEYKADGLGDIQTALEAILG